MINNFLCLSCGTNFFNRANDKKINVYEYRIDAYRLPSQGGRRNSIFVIPRNKWTIMINLFQVSPDWFEEISENAVESFAGI